MLSTDGSPNAGVAGLTLGNENSATATAEAAAAAPTAGSNIYHHVTFAATAGFADIALPCRDTLGTLTNLMLSASLGDTPGGRPHAEMMAEMERINTRLAATTLTAMDRLKIIKEEE